MQQLKTLFLGASFSGLVGLALAAPFLRNLLTPALALLVLFLAWRGRGKSVVDRVPGLPAIVWVVCALCVGHLVGLVRSDTPFSTLVWKEVVVALCLLCVFVVAWRRGVIAASTTAGFFLPISILAAGWALLGLSKAAFFERGVLISLGAGGLEQYTAGSSMIGDYNLFGLVLVVGAIGLVSRLPSSKESGWARAILVIAIALISAAALLAGSRRTIILVSALPFFWALRVFFQDPSTRQPARAALHVGAASLVALLVFWTVQHPEKPEQYVVWSAGEGLVKRSGQAHERGVESVAPNGPAEAIGPSANVTGIVQADSGQTSGNVQKDGLRGERGMTLQSEQIVNNATFGDLLGTMGPQGAYGFGSRTDRWRLGWDSLQGKAFWTGAGFAYHEEFSCRFAGCRQIDYPHAPLLAEWLISGLAGLLAGGAYLALAGLAAWRLGARGWLSGVTPAMLVTLPSVLISGDNLLSTPQFLSVALLAHLMARPVTAREG